MSVTVSVSVSKRSDQRSALRGVIFITRRSVSVSEPVWHLRVTFWPDGTLCGDGDPCRLNVRCTEGHCTWQAKTCNDDELCTKDIRRVRVEARRRVGVDDGVR